MSKVMFEIVDGPLEEIELVDIDRLKEYTINVAQANEFELVDKEGWSEFVAPGEKIEVGHALDSIRKELSENTIFSLCSQILSVVDIDIFRVIDGSMKEKINWTAVIPGSEHDHDQVLYQMGFDSSQVSKFDIYVDNVHVASYGSKVVGEQDVRWYCDEDSKPVLVGDGEEHYVNKDPKRLLELHKLQRETKKEYLHYSNNCWLECCFEDADGNDLTQYSEQLQADAEYVHGSISEGFGIEPETMQEIVEASKKGK